VFEVVAEPNRRRILDLLLDEERPVGDLVEQIGLSQPAVSKHLKVLERAGLISRGRDAQRRPARLEVGALKAVTDWLDNYRRFWEDSYQRLDELFDELQSAEAASDEPGGR